MLSYCYNHKPWWHISEPKQLSYGTPPWIDFVPSGHENWQSIRRIIRLPYPIKSDCNNLSWQPPKNLASILGIPVYQEIGHCPNVHRTRFLRIWSHQSCFQRFGRPPWNWGHVDCSPSALRPRGCLPVGPECVITESLEQISTAGTTVGDGCR